MFEDSDPNRPRGSRGKQAGRVGSLKDNPGEITCPPFTLNKAFNHFACISKYLQLSPGCQDLQLIPGPQWPPSADQPEVERNRGRALSILPSYKVAATQVEGIDDDHDC